MKIAITTTTASLDSPFDPRFGRAANFVIVDTETEEWETHSNPALNANGGAGVQAAQFIVRYGVQAVISGDSVALRPTARWQRGAFRCFSGQPMKPSPRVTR